MLVKMLRFNLRRAPLVFGAILVSLLTLHLCNRSYWTENIYKIHVNSLQAPPSQYVINSKKCRIPNLNPFNISILEFIQKVERTVCTAFPPLTTVTYNPLTDKHTLKVDYSATSYYTNSSRIQCCVKTMEQGMIHVMLSPCRTFREKFVMDEDSKFVTVFCLNDEHRLVYQNIHAAIVKDKKFIANKKKDPNKLNVLLIGFDSMSRLNFYRTLPQTATYLHTHGWTEMKGYSKVADNTLPNMMAFLAGLPPEGFTRAQTLDLDIIPYIWKEFSLAGYVTAYAEDQPLVSTFHCHLRGFAHPPTDHYFRDYIYVGELLFMGNGRPPGCIAYKSATQHVFDYLLDFVNVYKNDSFFGLFWVNQISHNNLNRASGEDEVVLELMRRLEKSGTMNTTMVALLSDHGLRVGDFRRTEHGWYEDRLPLLFISIPEWYKAQNHLYFSNLKKNSARLTSPYDLHLTMKHVLYGRASTGVPGCESCHSLFAEVSPNRSCPEAGVSPHWCPCHPFVDVPNNSFTIMVAERVVQAINEKVANDPDINPHYVCDQLKLRKLLYVREKDKPGVKELIVGVVTDPGGAEFEATVLFHNSFLSIEPFFSRLNSYGSESHCAENPVLKLFCYCKQTDSEMR